jgi:glutamate carboxypeptidase
MPPLAAAAEAHRAWAEAILEELVRLESPSGDVAALARCADAIAGHLAALGMQAEIRAVEGGAHVRAEIGSGRSVLLLGHYDTVWPVGTLARMPLRREGGRLSGPGAFDMKGGIAIGMLAMRALADAGLLRRRVVMLWTSDEEVGSGSSRALVEAEARASDAVLVLEPALPGGGVKTARRGTGQFEIVAEGRAAHAGIEPERGASAVHELARQILAVLALHDPGRGVLVNVGTVAGGTRGNVVAERAHAQVDVRIGTAADAGRVAAALGGLAPVDARVRLSVTGGFSRPPFERTPAVGQLYQLARSLARALGRDLPEGGTGGASDGNFTAALGVPTLDGLGAHGGGAHALDEHVELESLPFRAALVAGLLASDTMT